ncbi:D-alanyl-D-alanine carboxypeptidase/D-alanyl-D-alanine-endopeptidase [Spirulina subsalsa]|uniref:D-alanyl-D-alanine carboxypeptidase/D-alanyl-D-alanine endopeptidase n=1 Tax=Spirulina subsalsa TaxID=54311 RepID=UPI000C1F9538|nr:D-alanyl-D-alanine carboxypeptidase/D-alanyl-D-alanine-endopeptidase [Spirulina subsalsa]
MKKIAPWLRSALVVTMTAIASESLFLTTPALADPSDFTPELTAQVSPELPPEAPPTVAQADSIPIYVPPPERNTPGICEEFLEPNITEIIQRRGGRWGVLVQTLDGRTLYSYNANTQLIPASNIKLFTTAAALQRLNLQSSIRSQPLINWINVTNLRSNNNYADVLLSTLGGVQAARQSLTQLGVNGGFRQVDGSGLSRNNLATAQSLVETLRAMYFNDKRDVFIRSLPVAGKSGTLSRRFHNTRAQGRVYAKTGTLTGVRALSGYIEHPEYGMLVFSVLVNNPSQSGANLVNSVDSIVIALSQVMRC